VRWRRSSSQLLLNLAWSPVFFALHRMAALGSSWR
jgi:tryptophan-rich sensory protein